VTLPTSSCDRQVLSVNGERVINLRQMYARIQELHRTASTLFLEVFCIGGNAVIALDTDVAAAVLEQTLEQYRIPSAASADLLEAEGH
jgi:hypothetical protein